MSVARRAAPVEGVDFDRNGAATVMKRMAAWILGAAMIVLSAAATASQYTDLWWKPDESGWGVSVVQQDDTAFVMVYAYGSDGTPIWYVASDARITGHVGAQPVFSGTLYRGRGPWMGGTFDPSQVQLTQVGTLSLETLSSDRLRLHYTAEGAHVTKELVRLTWRRPEVDAYYISTFALRQTGPEGPPYGSLVYAADASLRLEGAEVLLRAEDQFGRTCVYAGSRAQAGKVAAVTGTFECSAGANGLQARAGTFTVTELELTAHGFTGYLRTRSPAGQEYGRFSGTRL
jgi:hypothetical protein